MNFKKHFKKSKIQLKEAQRKDFFNEVKHSAISLLVLNSFSKASKSLKGSFTKLSD
mgnify:CR=1 FL=1